MTEYQNGRKERLTAKTATRKQKEKKIFHINLVINNTRHWPCDLSMPLPFVGRHLYNTICRLRWHCVGVSNEYMWAWFRSWYNVAKLFPYPNTVLCSSEYKYPKINLSAVRYYYMYVSYIYVGYVCVCTCVHVIRVACKRAIKLELKN